jgi:hypothetical protein
MSVRPCNIQLWNVNKDTPAASINWGKEGAFTIKERGTLGNRKVFIAPKGSCFDLPGLFEFSVTLHLHAIAAPPQLKTQNFHPSLHLPSHLLPQLQHPLFL